MQPMIPFFRKIRKKMADDNRPLKYMRYAIGEILLVVIGILIALQINNWNEDKKERVTEQKLLNALHEDLLVNMDRLNKDIVLEQRSIQQATKIIKHLDERKPYDPSLDLIFKEALFSPDITISKSSYESIKFKGIDIIQNDSIQRSIINLYDVVYSNLIAETVRLEDQLWPSSVLPMIHKHFRVEINGNKPTDYNALLDDTTFKNMVIHRTGFRMQALELKRKALYDTEVLVEMIEKNKKIERM